MAKTTRKKRRTKGAEEPSGPSLYLIDGTGFVFRAYHALPPFTTQEGIPTGAVLGFTNMLFRLIEDHAPAFLAAVFDVSRVTFRNEIYVDYKAHRPPPPEDLMPQFDLVHQVVRGFNIPLVTLEGYEADDVIATLTDRAVRQGLSVTVVSSDKDLMQLAGDKVTLLDTMKDIRYGTEEVKEKFGVLPGQLADWLALCGDSSDNVPGVPAVGAKTATKLLGEHGDLETVLASADQVKGNRVKTNLKEFADQARLSRRLTGLDHDCPVEVTIDQLARVEPDSRALWQLFGKLAFTRLRQKVSPGSALDRTVYRTILEVEQLRGCLEEIRAAGRFAVDLETTSLEPVTAQIVGISLCWGEGKACYIPISHIYLTMPRQLRLATVLEELEPLLTDPDLPKYGQNFKYDWIVLKRAGVDMKGVSCDPMLASYVLDPSRNVHGLDSLALEHLAHTMISYKAVVGDHKRQGFDTVEVEEATRYAAEDAEVTYRLAELLGRRVAEEPKLDEIFREMEMPLSLILADMELRGVLLDTARLTEHVDGVLETMARLEAEVREEAGWDINLNSPKQLQQLLFDELGLEKGRRTKTGYSTDADVLADLAIDHPIAAKIDEFRALSKLKGTYLDALPLLVNRETGRVHTSYNQAVTATGRLSSSDPNLQNIPVRTELGRRIRRAFVAPPGRVLLSADYSQIELRVLAHLSEDPVLLEAFTSGQDVHRRTASEVFEVDPGQVSDEQRRAAKAVNFGVVYGQTDWGLARQLRIPQAVARQYIESYFVRYAGVKAFMDRTIEQARETRTVFTMLGRRRSLPDINSRKRAARLYTERVARNTPIQGTAADIMKLAMLRVHRALAAAGIDAPMILTVHDELVFEVLPADVEAVTELSRREMSGVLELAVPLRVDVGVGESWAEAH
jgi:DNA polymerase-1